METTLFALTLLLTSPQAIATGAASQPAATEAGVSELAALVDAVQNTYDGVRDFVADFEQVYTSASLGETRTSRGQVFFRKPGMMRWDYSTPTPRFLVSDGSRLWVYEPEQGQYYEEALADAQLPLALRFLMGEGRLADDFEVAARPADAQGRHVLQLTPRRSHGQVRRILLHVAPSNHRVEEVVLLDPLGNTNRIIFRNVRQNVDLPASGFRFSPPAGARRIEAPAP